MRKTYVYALLIALIIGAWLLSGKLTEPEPPQHATLAEQGVARALAAEDRTPIRVQARVSQAQRHTQAVLVRGRTQNKRSVVVRSETAGRVIARPVERGTRVATDTLLCRLAVDDREAQVTEAGATLSQARIDHAGAVRLQQKGFQADTDIARAKARLASAEAGFERAHLALARASIRAPFAGTVEVIQAEVGDYLQPGTPCATVLDLDPMLLVGEVSERDVQSLQVGAYATGVLGDGSELHGQVRFVGNQSNASTRTYPIEIELPNPDYRIRSGLSAQIRLPVRDLWAHLISPALLALDTAGGVGIRTISADGVVEWHDVDVIDDDDDGAWVTGLPDLARVITVGQELVVPGDRVDAVYDNAPNLPTANQVSDDTPKGGAARRPTADEPSLASS